jgi:FkbM family methyltransferase
MKIKYGIITNHIDITDICLTKLTSNNIITIPAGDINRSAIFTDPLKGVLKQIFIVVDDNITVSDDCYTVTIDITSNEITMISSNSINDIMSDIHSKLQIRYGSFTEELPEQKMAVRYITGSEKVLEIGGNIGRNSLVIAYLLGTNNSNLVTLESDINIARQLQYNRDLNKFDFHIESSALSKRNLIQRGWDTVVSDILYDGYNWVNTITWAQLQSKYNIVFDTLVLDCEGAFYYILMDMPEILDNINLIIMENDYHELSKKQYVDDILLQKNFYRDYFETGGWGPCYNNFFEVWKKKK